MNGAKIRLSEKEMALVTNADVILTKNLILQKAMMLLGAVQDKQQEYVKQNLAKLPGEIFSTSPKISKGENYKGLPYLILDYPRFFKKENIFTIRSMVWWGNYFSITLHVSGSSKDSVKEKILKSRQLLSTNNFYCCINDDAWEHHFESENYFPVSGLSESEFEDIVRHRSFLKLSQKFTLQQWDNADEIFFNYFKLISKIVAF